MLAADWASLYCRARSVDVVVPEHGRTSGGTLVTVHGSNFGPVEAEGQVVVLVAGVPCAQTTRVSDKVALCLTPPGIPGVKASAPLV